MERFFRNSLKLNRSTKKKLIILVCIITPFVLLQLITSIIEPTLLALCEIRAKNIGSSTASRAVSSVMSNIGYLDLITLERDEIGKIMALRANVIEMNKLSADIGVEINKIYSGMEETYVSIPIGNFTGNKLLAGRGPKMVVKIIPAGSVSSDFKTEFVSAGINQTRHRIYLEITSNVRIVAPFTTQTVTVVSNVNVAETVLIGNVPEAFYNLQGVQDVTSDDSLNLW